MPQNYWRASSNMMIKYLYQATRTVSKVYVHEFAIHREEEACSNMGWETGKLTSTIILQLLQGPIWPNSSKMRASVTSRDRFPTYLDAQTTEKHSYWNNETLSLSNSQNWVVASFMMEFCCVKLLREYNFFFCMFFHAETFVFMSMCQT